MPRNNAQALPVKTYSSLSTHSLLFLHLLTTHSRLFQHLLTTHSKLFQLLQAQSRHFPRTPGKGLISRTGTSSGALFSFSLPLVVRELLPPMVFLKLMRRISKNFWKISLTSSRI